jgi:hypothetical protein
MCTSKVTRSRPSIHPPQERKNSEEANVHLSATRAFAARPEEGDRYLMPMQGKKNSNYCGVFRIPLVCGRFNSFVFGNLLAPVS